MNVSTGYRRKSPWVYVRAGGLIVGMIAAAPWVIYAVAWYWRWAITFH